MRISAGIWESGGSFHGMLIFLCGGDKALYETCEPLLEVMGKKHLLLGPDLLGIPIASPELASCFSTEVAVCVA
eukprot:1246134-Rhodomonas_salina.2